MITLSNGTKHYLGEEFAPDIEVIAKALSNINRFTGHVGQYSVAQHCVYAYRMAWPEHKRAALLHDATEAYLGDVSSPLKRLLPKYQELEDDYHRIIDSWYGVNTRHDAVKLVDLRLLVTEAKCFGVWTEEFPDVDPYSDEELPDLYLGCRWSPRFAETMFMQAYRDAFCR